MNVLFHQDFSVDPAFNPADPDSPYKYFEVPGVFTANDGVAGVDCGKLIVNSSPFNWTTNNGLDHPKYIAYLKAPFRTVNANDTDSIVFQSIIDAKQTGLESLPAFLLSEDLNGIKDPSMDFRPCASAMNVIDFNNMLVFDFILTDKMVYALYERLPFNRTEWNGPGSNYSAFTHVIPALKRSSPVSYPFQDEEFLKLEISYNYRRGVVRWYVNDKMVFEINAPGVMIENKYRVLEHNKPDQRPSPDDYIGSLNLWFGFGNFSIMDAGAPINNECKPNLGLIDLSMGQVYPTVNPIEKTPTGKSIAQSFISTYAEAGNTTNFGQGAILGIKELKVYTSPLL